MKKTFLIIGIIIIISFAFMVACDDDNGGTGPDYGEIEVTVTADGDPEEAVVLELYYGSEDSATSTITTNSEGVGLFTNVDPGDYEVEIEIPAWLELAPGEQARKQVTVSAGETSTLEFALTEN